MLLGEVGVAKIQLTVCRDNVGVMDTIRGGANSYKRVELEQYEIILTFRDACSAL